MNNHKTPFHGSDIEKISSHYNITKDSLVNFAANVNPLGFPKEVSHSIAKNLDLLSTYPDREYTKLREVIASYCNVEREQIMVGNGSSELIALLIQQISPKKTLILGPTYSEYERELKSLGSSITYYNLKWENSFELNIECFLESLSGNYDLLILCNPNNPTSSFISKDTIEKILNTCKTYNTFVMIDETYVEFVPDNKITSTMPLVPIYDNFMTLRGVSKFFAAPGLRLGYGVTRNLGLLDRMKETIIPWSLNSIGAYAGELLLVDSSYIEATKELIANEKRHFLSELGKLSGINAFEANANFILVQITKENITAAETFIRSLEEGLILRDCSSFEGLEGEFIRFCIMNPEDNRRLLDLLKALFY
jgi:threonine-phosphate decarboxylase